MKQYKIKQDGFDIGIAKGKRNAIQWLKKHFEFEGIVLAQWGTFKYNICKIKTVLNEFTIEEV